MADVGEGATVPHVGSTIALVRVGQPEAVGAAVAALQSGRTGWMNGARVEISGGQSQ